MATSYLAPGVYVEEVSAGSKPIEGVGTSIAGFLGFAADGPYNKPTLITNWTQFSRTFGKLRPDGAYDVFIDGAFLAHSVYGYFNNGGGVCYVVRLEEGGKDSAAGGAHATLQAAPAQRELPVRTGSGTGSLRLSAKPTAPDGVVVEILAAVPEPPAPPAPPAAKSEGQPSGTPGVESDDAGTQRFTIGVRGGDIVERYENVSLRRSDSRFVEKVVNLGRGASKLIQALLEGVDDETSVVAPPELGMFKLESAPPALVLAKVSPGQYIGDQAARTGLGGLDAIEDLTIVCVPDLMSAYLRKQVDDEGLRAVQSAMIDHCERMGNRVAILDAPPGLKPQEVRDWKANIARYDSSYATLYYPWIQVADPASKQMKMVPPSGHIAGVWARVDSERGVHKAPANETIRGCIDLEYQTTMGEQTLLNPIGINCIRAFPNRGIRIWGARTLSSDPEWRYLNVRRLFNFVRESVRLGTQWAVFEPNDMDLWLKMRRDISSFLTRIYMTGALFGATDRESYFVRCDSENNTRETIDAGQVIVEVGIAPTKPAEFVIFRISQYTPGAETA
jgi:phage tail sheath protein FI